MAEFRKKPVVIDAVLYNPDAPFPEGVDRPWSEASDRRCAQCGGPWGRHARVKTLEGEHHACPGDWIITGVQGERYPCKPDIFAATYEPVGSEPPTEAGEQEPYLKNLDAIAGYLDARGLAQHARAIRFNVERLRLASPPPSGEPTKPAYRIPGQPANGRSGHTRHHGWDVLVNVTCVECPDCAFVMDYDHEDGKGGYTCPNCATESRAGEEAT